MNMHYQSLIQEMDSLVGANGEVKAGYEDRVQFIMTTGMKPLGMEMTMQDGVIQNYQKERESINQLLETKKAELILKANEEAYAQAIQKKTEAATVYANAQQTFNDILKQAEDQALKSKRSTWKWRGSSPKMAWKRRRNTRMRTKACLIPIQNYIKVGQTPGQH